MLIFSEYFGIKPINTTSQFDHQPISAKARTWFAKSLASADIGSSLSKTRYMFEKYTDSQPTLKICDLLTLYPMDIFLAVGA